MIKNVKNATIVTIGVKRVKPIRRLGKNRLWRTGQKGIEQVTNVTKNWYRQLTNDVEIMEEAFKVYEQRLYCSILALVIMEEQQTNNRKIEGKEAERIYSQEYMVRGGIPLKERIQRGNKVHEQFLNRYRAKSFKQRVFQYEDLHQDYVSAVVEALEEIDDTEATQQDIMKEKRYAIRRNQLHELIYRLLQTHEMLNGLAKDYTQQLEN